MGGKSIVWALVWVLTAPGAGAVRADLAARWIGQEGADHTGEGPAVGPDGVQDVRLELSGLIPGVEVRAVAVDGPGLTGWRYGTNPQGRNDALLIRRGEDPSRADLYFQAGPEVRGRTLAVTVDHANDTNARAVVVAGEVAPGLLMPAPVLPTIEPNALAVEWLGQDGAPVGRPGDVRLALSGLPGDRPVAAVALSNAAREVWSARLSDAVPFEPEPYAHRLEFQGRPDDPSRATLAFAPSRDETGGTLALRLVFGDGGMTVIRFPGGSCEPARRAGPGPKGEAITARPGDDLHDLVTRHDRITLTGGTYRLDRPLVLERPMEIAAEPGAMLLFDQPPGAPPWREAISVRAGRVSLSGFAVRFAGPVRWEEGVPYGPAVVGAGPPESWNGPVVGLSFERLDLQSPPATNPAGWEEATRLLRLVGTSGGRIEGCTLKGGPVQLSGGPWQVIGNESRGTLPGTWSPAVIAAHDTHGLVVRDNRAAPVEPAGKTWRFLVLASAGYHDRIEGNRVAGFGPRADDTIPNMNAPEIILTESYRLHFEGRPRAVSADGRLVRIGQPQGEPARTGAVVAIVAGPEAGTWRRVAQAIDATTYLVDPPLPTSGDLTLSIVTGFVGLSIRDNTIETPDRVGAVNLVLVGNHFGTEITGNRLVGARGAFKIAACPTESPVHWGWTRAPMFGLTIERNTLEDTGHGGLLGVEAGGPIKTTRGRLYLSATFRDNTLKIPRPELPTRPVDVGDPNATDPAALRIEGAGNRVEGPPGVLPDGMVRVNVGTINGQAISPRPEAAPTGSAASPRR